MLPCLDIALVVFLVLRHLFLDGNKFVFCLLQLQCLSFNWLVTRLIVREKRSEVENWRIAFTPDFHMPSKDICASKLTVT